MLRIRSCVRPSIASVASVALASGLAVAGCGPADARFTTRVASDFAPRRHAVSVLGVYKDGQMSADAWETLRARVSRALGADACEAGYADALLTSNGALSQAIDDYARSNGPTDELVAQLAPAARGDLVLVVTLSGQLPAPKPKTTASGSSAVAPMGSSGRTRRAIHNPGFASSADTNELDLSASLFSVALRRSVGLVTMQYYGASVDDAVAKFAERLAATLPEARCDGWDWTAKIDPDAIRRSMDP